MIPLSPKVLLYFTSIESVEVKKDTLATVREFHKKLLRINTPPDKKEANKNISIKVVKPKETTPLPIHKFVSNKRSAILDTMSVQAKRKSFITTMNTITNFGKIDIQKIIKPKSIFSDLLCFNMTFHRKPDRRNQ